ncbi:MAG: glycerophosphodiester phosphodiesterase [Lentisphaerota bacterium]
MKRKVYLAGLFMASIFATSLANASDEGSTPIIIAHRGASGYVPEHTFVAKAVAFAQDADYLEQDVSLTKDNQVVIMHDILLDYNTNVKQLYPDKARKDGHFYIRDFTLDEIKKLTVHERTGEHGENAVFSDRFPETDALPFSVPTLQEELTFIQGMNKSFKKNKGIYLELKQPKIYPDHGKEFAKIVLDILAQYGYKDADSNCYIQCFDPFLLKYIKYDLHSKLKLIQLIGDNTADDKDIDYDKMLTKEGLKEISTYACGIGPSIKQLFTNYGKSKDLKPNNVCKWAHEDGLKLHPYTLRNDLLPDGLTYNQVCDALFKKAGVDGIFTDYPDMGVSYIKTNFPKKADDSENK